MAHEVETMYYTSNEANGRFVPWHGLGTPVENSPTSADALHLAGLDWNVVQKPIFMDGKEIPNYKANVRDVDNSVLGVVSNRYSIVQNKDAFDFTDSLIGGDVRYETAGSLKNGKTIWLLAKLPKEKILGDDVEPYICFTNSHDGRGSIKVCMTPIRVVCNNTLNFALADAKRCWSTKHMGDMSLKLTEAKLTLKLANEYMYELGKEADVLANSKITNDDIKDFLADLFPCSDDASDRQKNNIKKAKDEIVACYFAPDIYKYVGTKYGLMNAMADWCTHATPARVTADYQSNNWGRIIDGHPVFDRAYDLVKTI